MKCARYAAVSAPAPSPAHGGCSGLKLPGGLDQALQRAKRVPLPALRRGRAATGAGRPAVGRVCAMFPTALARQRRQDAAQDGVQLRSIKNAMSLEKVVM